MKKPLPLSTRLAEMRKLMDEYDNLSAKLKPVSERLEKIREDILNEYTATELSSVTASGLRATRVVTPVPTIANQMKFFAYATKKANWDLLQKTCSTPAWRERMKAKKKVPGVDPFDRVSLSVTRIKS